MSAAADTDPCQPLRNRIEAMTRWLVDEGHITPLGARQLRSILAAETPEEPHG